MSDDLLEFGTGPAFERIQKLSQRAKKLPPESRELVSELMEAFTISVEELQVASEELNQQNAELVAAREEIELQRSRYRDMFEFAPDGYLVTDPTGIIREANKAAVNLLGVSRQNLVGKSLVIYIDPVERERFQRHLERLVKRKDKGVDEVEWEMRFKPRRQQEFPAALTVAPFHDSKGKLSGLRWLLRDISESKRAEERERLLTQVREQNAAILETNRLLHALIETMPVGAIIVDGKGNILLTNTAGREIMGEPLRGTIASPERSHTTHYPDGTPFPIQDFPMARALKEGRYVKDVEILIRRADGEERIIRASAAAILDESGEVDSGITVFQDITGRKRSRKALQQHTERLQALRRADEVILSAGSLDELVKSILPYTRELVPCQFASVLAIDLKTNEVTVLGMLFNGTAHLVSDRPAQLDKDWPLEELAQGEILISEELSKFAVQSPSAEALQEAGVRYMAIVPLVAQDELLGVLKLGRDKPFHLTDDQREIISQVAGELAIGIRQVRLREELQRHTAQLERKVTIRTGALHASEERFRTILDAAVFGIALLDTKGRVVQSNPALQTMLGYNEAELQGMTFSDYSHPDDTKEDEELHRALDSLETGHYQTEKRYVRKDGQVRWSELTVSRVEHTRGGKPWLAVAIMEDITEKKKIQETLARTERLTLAGRLGTSLAHEINNPVQAVIGCLGLAEEMLEEETDVRRYLDIAMQELERTADIVSQLRDLGREPKSKPKEPTDLNAFIERILMLTRKRCQNQNVTVEWQPGKDLPSVPLEPERIQQVLLNIVLNALNAMEGGGQLIVSTHATSQPEGVFIAVRDTGVGIEPERLENIFEPFHSDRSDGLGLGLYISKNIVDDHDGRIDVESVPGDGATFTVWLPV